MYSKVKIAGHPVHPMLVPFPIVFYVSTVVSFIVYALGGDPFWLRTAFVCNVAGVVMALVAATPGFIDWYFGIPKKTHARKDGRVHMALNVTALALFSLNLLVNGGSWSAAAPVSWFGVVLPLLGLLVTAAAGYYGWSLVQTHHVGVQLSPEEERCVRKISHIKDYDIPKKRAA
ncbi:MAG: DUF2231 domain-containing protein [Acidobacteriota bacterium]